jgi:hypothetical protein
MCPPKSGLVWASKKDLWLSANRERVNGGEVARRNGVAPERAGQHAIPGGFVTRRHESASKTARTAIEAAHGRGRST